MIGKMSSWSSHRALACGIIATGASVVGCGAGDTQGTGDVRGTAEPTEVATASEELNLGAPAGSGWVARHNLTASQFEDEVEEWTASGYRLTDVDGYDTDGSTRFAALFEKVSGPEWYHRVGLTSAALQTAVTEAKDAGYYPVMADGYTVAGSIRYSVIFHKNTAGLGWRMRHGISSSSYQTEFEAAVAEGLRPIHVSGHDSGGSSRFTAIWTSASSPSLRARHDLTSSQYQDEVDDGLSDGFRVVHVDEYYVGTSRRYAAIWHKTSVATAERHGLTSSVYDDAFSNYKVQGYRPIALSATGDGTNERFAMVWRNPYYSVSTLDAIDDVVEQAMEDGDIRGLSLAMAKDGRLKFAKAYGEMDDTNASSVRTRYRWASVSKPITSAMIQRLIQDGDLSLDDRVFGNSGRLGNTHRPTNGFTTRQLAIRVRHLLEHTAGGWGNSSNDPMGQQKSLDHDDLIAWTLQNIALSNDPGTAYDYSNFGYCLLGRIIERVTEMDYDDAVRDRFLDPAGADSFAIGGNTLADRLSNEAQYYDESNPYSSNVSRMDSHGGWVGTPIDLLRWARRVDGFTSTSDYLNAASITRMTTESDVCQDSDACRYAQGWYVNASQNWWHGGKLRGTRSNFVRTGDGYLWAAVINEAHGDDTNIDLDSMMWDVRGALGTPPDVNFF